MQINPEIDYSASTSPNIFDVLCNSNLIAPLLLANLLSEELWLLSEKIQSKLALVAPATSDKGPELNKDIDLAIRSIQVELNKKFTHLQTTEVGDIYGYLDLETEKKRLGEGKLNNQLCNVMDALLARKTFSNENLGRSNLILDQISKNQFPAYLYQNFDLVNAHKKYSRRGTKSPGGLTSCLDETAIFIALVIAMKPQNIQAIAVLSSWTHYSAFGYDHNNEAWWFYGKNCLLSKSQWDFLVDDKFEGDPQACFDAYFSDFNKITTVSGSFSFQSGQCGIESENLSEYVRRIDKYFGIRLRQLDEALNHIQYEDYQSPFATILRESLNIRSRDDALTIVQALPESLNRQVAYSYRSWDVKDHQPYLEAARRNPLTIEMATKLSSINDALVFIQHIEGSESIFGDRNRVTLPDETLRLRSGTDRDKALLLHVLLEHMIKNFPSEASRKIRSIYGAKESWVLYGNDCYQLSDLRIVSEPTTSEILFSL